MRTVYGIKDTAGALIAEHVRVQLSTGKRMYWQLPSCDPRDGLGGLSTSDLPLYGSEGIRCITPGETVIVTEGERARDAIIGCSPYPAFATVTGASGTPGEDALSPLLPFDVVLWPDHDEPGEGHMTRVAASIIRLGGRARRLAWGREKGDDAADFFERGGTRVMLDLMVRASAPWIVKPEAPRKAVRPSYDSVGDDWRVDRAKGALVAVVEDRLGAPKKKDGRSLFWCCPFHTERTASFKVDLKEPFFRCFGCGAKGDVFTFMRRLDGIEFKDALHELAPPKLLGAAIPW